MERGGGGGGGGGHTTFYHRVLPDELREEQVFPFGWTVAGLLSCLTAQRDFTRLFLGFPRDYFPRPAMLARASVFPQALSHHDLSLRTVLF